MFLVFEGDPWYPRAADDYVGAFDTLEQAKMSFDEHDMADIDSGWGFIIDGSTGEIVYLSGYWHNQERMK